MADGEAVANYEVTVRYAIRKWDQGGGGDTYDWIADNGDESDELFPSVDEAIYDIKGRHG